MSPSRFSRVHTPARSLAGCAWMFRFASEPAGVASGMAAANAADEASDAQANAVESAALRTDGVRAPTSAPLREAFDEPYAMDEASFIEFLLLYRLTMCSRGCSQSFFYRGFAGQHLSEATMGEIVLTPITRVNTNANHSHRDCVIVARSLKGLRD